MPIWSDIATWVGPTSNTSGTIADHMYVVVHTADGSYDGTIAWQRNPTAKVSSHFIVAKDGRIGQMLDTNAKGWTQIEGNPYSISIENEGNENTPLTVAQIEACARILAKAHLTHGVPLQLTGTVGTRGLGHHSMGAESGVNWGHSQCPGYIIKSQKPQILARAQQIVAGSDTPGGFMTALSDLEQRQLFQRVEALLYGRDSQTDNGSGGKAVEPNGSATALKAIAAKVGAPVAVTLSDAQIQAIATAVTAHADTPLGPQDQPAIVAALKQYYAGAQAAA